MGALVTSLGTNANVVGRLRRDTYRGGDAVELRVESVDPV